MRPIVAVAAHSNMRTQLIPISFPVTRNKFSRKTGTPLIPESTKFLHRRRGLLRRFTHDSCFAIPTIPLSYPLFIYPQLSPSIMPHIVKVKVPTCMRRSKHVMETREKRRKGLFNAKFAEKGEPGSSWTWEALNNWAAMTNSPGNKQSTRLRRVRRPTILREYHDGKRITRFVRYPADSWEAS